MAKFFSDHQRDTRSVVAVFEGSKSVADVALPRCRESREEKCSESSETSVIRAYLWPRRYGEVTS